MSQGTNVQPALGDLLSGYLARQAEAQAAGIASFDNEVTPYEVGPVQPLDPKLAYDEALSAVGAGQLRQKAPPHWSALVAGHESTAAVAFCVGNFPQLMRNFQTLLPESGLGKLRPEAGRPAVAPELASWVNEVAGKGQFPQLLLALGVLRLAKHFDAADTLVQAQDVKVPADWRAAWDNEKAALAWHAGRHAEARTMWDRLEPTVAVLFNRGMAALFAGEMASAKQHLSAAVAMLPDTSAWHHLGRLYLTMAQLR